MVSMPNVGLEATMLMIVKQGDQTIRILYSSSYKIMDLNIIFGVTKACLLFYALLQQQFCNNNFSGDSN